MNRWNGLPPPFFNTRETGRHLSYRHDGIAINALNYYLTDPEQIICSLDAPPGCGRYREEALHADTIYFQIGKWMDDANESLSEEEGTLYALILEPVEGKEGTYMRIGIAEIPEENEEASQWSTKVVVII
jgi:hypothetical protein